MGMLQWSSWSMLDMLSRGQWFETHCSKRKLDRKEARLKGLKASQKSKPQLAEQN